MSKTVRYFMKVNTLNTSGSLISISKKEFNKQLLHYKNQIAENHDKYKEDIDEYKSHKIDFEESWNYSDLDNCLDNIKQETKEYDTYINTYYTLHDECTFIMLAESVCKPGFCFK